MSAAASCSTRAVRPRLATAVWLVAVMVVIAAAACNRHAPTVEQQPPAAQAAPPASSSPPHAAAVQGRDLSIDESMGGHTLARHVGKTDADLAERLRREPQISAASTYTDRAAAARTVTAALDSSSGQLASWSRRQGRRPNLVLHYVSRDGPFGRSLGRGAHAAVPCKRAILVLRWDERRDRFYVLTSYPEADR